MNLRKTTRNSAARVLIASLAVLALGACTSEMPKPPGQVTQIDGVGIHYTEAGQGERAVVLIHGFGSGAFTWRGIQERVPEEFTAYALDLPGFGYSEKPDTLDYGLPRFAATVARFIKQKIGRPVVLAGNSMGGATAAWTAANYPELVSGVVLIDSAGAKLEEEHLPFIFFFLQTPKLGPLMMRLQMRFVTAMTIRQVYGHKERVTGEIIDEYYRPGTFPGAAYAWHRTLRDLVAKTDGGDVLRALDKIKQPALLMRGEKDPWISEAAVAQFEEHLPQARLRLYKGLGHVPMEEAPEEVAPDLFGFAREVFEKSGETKGE